MQYGEGQQRMRCKNMKRSLQVLGDKWASTIRGIVLKHGEGLAAEHLDWTHTQVQSLDFRDPAWTTKDYFFTAKHWSRNGLGRCLQGYRNDPCNCHHLLPFMSPRLWQGTHGSFKSFPKNAMLSFCRNIKSRVHVLYAGWLILPCSAPARTHDFKNFLSSIQVFCCKTFTMLWYDSSYRCLCVQSSMSSLLHHFSYRRLSVLICLQTPVSFSSCFCTSVSAAPLRIASLTLLLNVEWRSW